MRGQLPTTIITVRFDVLQHRIIHLVELDEWRYMLSRAALIALVAGLGRVAVSGSANVLSLGGLSYTSSLACKSSIGLE